MLTSMSMNKEAAAKFLGKSTRRLPEYVSRGQLKVTYVDGPTGKLASYNLEDLKRLKTEIETPSVRAVVSSPSAPPLSPAVVSEAVVVAADAFLPRLRAMLEQTTGAVPIHHKLLLGIREAALLTGLSRKFLLRELKEGKLKGKKDTLGRGWRIRRTDLDSFISKV